MAETDDLLRMTVKEITPELKTVEFRAFHAMMDKHHWQMDRHQVEFGPLGVLRKEPTKEELDNAYLDFVNEKKQQAPKKKKK